jgi:hypothetical protein
MTSAMTAFGIAVGGTSLVQLCADDAIAEQPAKTPILR